MSRYKWFMHVIDVAIRTYNVVYIHYVILYEWQLSLTNIYEHINTKMSCPYFELQQVFEG